MWVCPVSSCKASVEETVHSSAVGRNSGSNVCTVSMHRSYDTDMWCLVTGQDNSSIYYYRCMQEVRLGQDLGVLCGEHEQLCLGGDQLDLELFTI